MPVLVRPGVTFSFAPAGFRILEALKTASKSLGIPVTITSGSDGVHSSPTDPHYSGQAYDIRTKDMPPSVKPVFIQTVLTLLGPQFSGFLEDPSSSNEHFHVQRASNTVYSILDYLKADI